MPKIETLENKLSSWKVNLLFIFLIIFIIFTYLNSNHTIHELFKNTETYPWNAVDKWIDSSKCALETRTFLTGCINGYAVPISDISPADDIGHALILDLKALFLGSTATYLNIALLNNLINYVGILLLSLLLFIANARVPAIAILFLINVIPLPVNNSTFGAGPHAAFIGIFCFSALSSFAIYFSAKQCLNKFGQYFFISLGILLLGVSSLLRNSMALIGLMVAVFYLIYFTSKKNWISWKVASLIFITLLLVFLSPKWALLLRDYFYSLPVSSNIQSHGFAHNLYIGLGEVPNKFGLEFLDDYGMEAVAKVNQKISYLSIEYFQVLTNLYIEKWITEPAEMIRIYFFKFLKLLNTPFVLIFPIGGFYLYLAYLIFLLKKISPKSTSDYDSEKIIIITSVIFLLLYSLQSLLTVSDIIYLSPIRLLLILAMGVHFQIILKKY